MHVVIMILTSLITFEIALYALQSRLFPLTAFAVCTLYCALGFIGMKHFTHKRRLQELALPRCAGIVG